MKGYTSDIRLNADDEGVRVETGIPGNAQESEFTNATLQGCYESVEYSIATYIEAPDRADQNDTAEYLRDLLGRVHSEFPELRFHVQIGPGGSVD